MEIRLFGVEIRIGFAFFWVLAILLCFNFRQEIKLALLFSVLHEAGHLTAIICLKQRPKQIRFGLFGMTIVRRDDTAVNYTAEIITALAGPLVNILSAIAFYYIYSEREESVFQTAFAVNVLIAAFNLLPVFSLDGGRALESFLKSRFDAQKADTVIKLVSFVFVLIIDYIGILILIKSEYNFTLLVTGIYLTVLVIKKS